MLIAEIPSLEQQLPDYRLHPEKLNSLSSAVSPLYHCIYALNMSLDDEGHGRSTFSRCLKLAGEDSGIRSCMFNDMDSRAPNQARSQEMRYKRVESPNVSTSFGTHPVPGAI